MKNKKAILIFICTVIFLVVIAGLRGFNIFIAKAASDVTYSTDLVRTLDTVHDLAMLMAYGFSAAVVVYCGKVFSRSAAFGAAALMSAVALADRAFCLIYDISVSNINVREMGTIATAVSWLTIDFLFYGAMYFGGALISRSGKGGKEKKESENGGGEKAFPFSSILGTVGIMTVLQLVSQIVICVQFFMEYDDVTVTEKTQMLGDILWILVEYGGILAAFTMIFYLVVSSVCEKSTKKS